MSYFAEKAAYLKGLAEGLEIDGSTKEGKLLNAMLDVIVDMADELEMLDEKQDDMLDLISELADDDCDCDCCDCDDDDLDYFEIECEKCGHVICLDEDLLDSDDDIVCPVCGEVIELEFEDYDCGCCDCDCE